MRWFFTLFGTVVAVLFLSFIAWIATRVLHWDGANVWVGRVMIWDLYAIAVVMSYVAFVFQKLFGFSKEKAHKLMLDVHLKGKAVVSSGPREKAELDVFRLHEHGLWATMEQDSAGS